MAYPDNIRTFVRVRKITDCPRVLCAAPACIARKGMPRSPDDLSGGGHDCLNLRYPGAPEFRWPLQTRDGVRRVTVNGPFESDHGDVLTSWALEGHGIVLKPVFEIIEHMTAGRLVPVLAQTPPVPIQMACLYMHRRRQDPKARLFIDFMTRHILASLSQQAAARTADA